MPSPGLWEQSDRFRPPGFSHVYQVVRHITSRKELVKLPPGQFVGGRSTTATQQDQWIDTNWIRRNPTDCRKCGSGSPSENQGPTATSATGGPSNANTPIPRRAQSPNKCGIGSPRRVGLFAVPMAQSTPSPGPVADVEPSADGPPRRSGTRRRRCSPAAPRTDAPTFRPPGLMSGDATPSESPKRDGFRALVNRTIVDLRVLKLLCLGHVQSCSRARRHARRPRRGRCETDLAFADDGLPTASRGSRDPDVFLRKAARRSYVRRLSTCSSSMGDR